MQSLFLRKHTIFACLMVLLLASACLQNARDAGQPNAVAQSRDNEVPPVVVEVTEEVTVDPVIDDALPTETATVFTVTETLVPTATLSDESLQFRAGEAIDQPVSDLSIGGGTAVAQVIDESGQNEQPDPFELTATELVAQITRTAEAPLTQTAQAQGVGLPTNTPIPQVFATQTPIPGVIQPTSTPFVTSPGGACVHEVLAGENLFQLSQRYGVSINELASASGITNIQLIFVGDRINIPGCGTTGVLPPPTSVPIPTATPFGANTTGTTDLTGGTGGTGTTVTTTTAIGGGRTHTVQQYETLFEISLTYGVPISSIAAANGITDINRITIGDVLTIPAQ